MDVLKDERMVFKVESLDKFQVPNTKEILHSSCKHVTLETDLTDSLDYYYLYERKPCLLPQNTELKAKVYGNDSGFQGGEKNDFREKMDFSRYDAAREKLVKSGFAHKLQSKFAEHDIRSRRRDEHDGEYDYDRRWDVNPYTRVVKKKGIIRALEINCHTAFHGGIRESHINEFGAIVCAIILELESKGITVAFNFHDTTKKIAPNTHISAKVCFKKFGEYLPKKLLVNCITANYYRRVMLLIALKAADTLMLGADSSFGSPPRYDLPIAHEPGIVNIYSMQNNKEDDYLDAICKALGV